ncbi:MAG TPA: DNA polymerase III subunit gamma and tau [Propionibacteriaceae bacterium]|nr:DNA polymerase III subunit gamma and tau [Propionibacteriaceae bacterium]
MRADTAPRAPLALYRRYRPDTFDDVIGQEHVTEPLKRALTNNKVNHAYLFSGPRGCGKTTSARILARCLNCQEGPTPYPCGECQSCRDLARGGLGSIDVIEMDAASHGGVDDARDLRERAFFAPVHSRYKIYIVDEAHMVTTAGFNAMLKLVEEPPPHVKFIFATTEPEKVIGTIRSRTHHYPFRLVPPKVLSGYLAHLCDIEKVPVEAGVLPLVVRAGAGSVRDSLSVLDQLLGGASETGVSYAHASTLLGYTPDNLLDQIMDAFAAGDSAGVFSTIDKVIEVGQDPRRFAEDLLRRLRDLVIIAAVPDAVDSGLLDVSADQAERFRTQAAGMGPGELTRAAEVIATGLTEMRGTTAPRLHLELMCARVLLPGADTDGRGLHARLDRLERRVGMSVGDAAPAPAMPQSRPPADAEPAQTPTPPRAESHPPESHLSESHRPPAAPLTEEARSEQPPPRPRAAEPQVQRPAAQRPPQAQRAPEPPRAAPAPVAPRAPGRSDFSVVDVRRLWPQVLEEVKGRRRFAWILLSQNAQVLDVADGVLVLAFANHGARDNFMSGGSQDVLRDCLVEVMGADLRIDPVVAGSTPRGGAQPAQPSRPVSQPASPPPTSDPPPASVPDPAATPDAPPSDAAQAATQWSSVAKQNIRATASGPSPVEAEPGMDEIDPDADVTLDESGDTATQLIAAELGAQLIGEDEH